MDSRIGLDYIVENPDYTKKLAVALDTTNATVKKQVFKLLAALCVYNEDGYKRSLETLERYKESKGGRYRFKVMIDELRHSKDVDYLSTIVAFMNCTIISAKSLKERNRLRNEYIGLKILDAIYKLRATFANSPDNELFVQLDIFEEQRYADESQSTGPNGVDLNCHQDIFYAILKQVTNTPQEIAFLSILQHLLRIDSSVSISDLIWDTAEKLVHRATLCETKEDIEKLLRAPSYHQSLNKLLRGISETGGRCQCSCHSNGDGTCSAADGRSRKPLTFGSGDGSRTPSVLSPTNSSNAFSPELLASLSRAISPPPKVPGAPPILPASGNSLGSASNAPPMSCAGGPPPPPPPPPSSCPPPPPPPPGSSLALSMKTPSPTVDSQIVKLPQQFTPKPKNKMKSLNWTKIPSNKVVGKNNLWSMIAKAHNGSPNNLDFSTIEDLFCQQSTMNGQASPRLGNRADRNGRDNLDRKKRESSEINLLDGKRSLNVNIFLKQFRSSNEEIIGILRRGAHDEIGAEKLRGLLKVLPESDEMEMLRTYNGDRQKLGYAEKFLLQLIELPHYKIRCEGMLLKEEFASNMAFLEPAIETIKTSVHELKHCKELHEVLYMLLVAGNFLNSGGYAGDAAGFKMMSLLKMAETRANKPGMNLIHYVAQEAELKHPNLLKFPDILSNLEEASKLSIDNLKADIAALTNRVSKISQQVSIAGDDVKQQMEEFLNFAQMETIAVQKEIDGLEKVREDMADFLCEDLQSFKLEECFKIFHNFCQKFKAAIEENDKRIQQEKRAEARRKQREEQLSMKKKLSGENRPPSYSGSESDNIIDMLLSDIHSGFQRYVDSGSLKSNRGSGKAKRSSPDGSATPAELCRMNSLTSSVPSEEDPTASPRVIRRRIGSSNSAVNGYGADTDGIDTQSPDITPNGTLRRRRNRLSSEDRDESLIDFLRQEGKTPDCGSLDRSWIRRSSRRRRPEIIAAELNDRERPASPGPSPLLERRAITLDPEANKPKQWRLKIEEWLQENEKEQEREKKLKEKIALERSKRQEMEQRETDLSSASIEASDEHKYPTKKAMSLNEVKTDSELYSNKSKHSSLNPETRTGAETTENIPLKDKSKWRKSTLNVANSSESIDDERRRSRSRKQKSDSEFDDTISFYMRSPERQDDKPCFKGNSELILPASNLDSSKSFLQDATGESIATHGRFETNDNHPHMTPTPCKEEIERNKPSQEAAVSYPVINKKDNEKIILAQDKSDTLIYRNRLYQSMKEPNYNKVDHSKNDLRILDDQALKPSFELNFDKSFTGKQKYCDGSKVDSPEVDDEGNFDRFSFMRKTTRRTKPRHKVFDSETGNVSEETKNSGTNSNKFKSQTPLNNSSSTEVGTDFKRKENIPSEPQICREPQNISDSKSTSGNVFKKNATENTKSSDHPEDSKRKDKSSTSLKARLSKRLLSLTENLKATNKSVDSVDLSLQSKPTPEEKLPFNQDPSCPRIDKVLQERRASLKEEKPNPPIMEHREKILSRPKKDTIQNSQRNIQDEYEPIMAEPQLLKESFIADMNNIKIAHATPVNHDIKIIESFPAQNKGKEESEKDEGFEETQSQLSEAASQGAGSNYDTDLADSPPSVRQTKNKNTEVNIDNDTAIVSDMKENTDEKNKSVPLNKSVKKSTERKAPLQIVPNPSAKLQKESQNLKETSQMAPAKAVQIMPSIRKTPVKTQNITLDKNCTKQDITKKPVITRRTSASKVQKAPRSISEENVYNTVNRNLGTKNSRINQTDSSPKIGRRVSDYTKAIKSMTNSLRASKKYENYDVTQSMPPTPSDEHKTFMSGITKPDDSKKIRSTSSVYSPRSQSSRSSEKSLASTFSCPSRKGSDKSSLSRRSSDRSLNLSRKSSEASVVTVRSANRRGSSKIIPVASHIVSRKSTTTPVTIKTKSPQLKQVPASNKSNAKSSTATKPNKIVRRTSSDRSCGFMKATSSSSAKTTSSKPTQDQKNTKVRSPLSTKTDITQNRIRRNIN